MCEYNAMRYIPDICPRCGADRKVYREMMHTECCIKDGDLLIKKLKTRYLEPLEAVDFCKN